MLSAKDEDWLVRSDCIVKVPVPVIVVFR